VLAAAGGGAASCAPIDPRAEAAASAQASLSKVADMIDTLKARVMVAPYVDHTLLKPEATPEDVQRLCTEAIQYGFQAVCVNGSNVRTAYETLKALGAHQRVKVCAVVGFPLGATTTAVKSFEAMQAIEEGACEIDMVVNVGRVKAQDWDYVLRDIGAVVGVCKNAGVACKVILETSLLNDEEKKAVSKLSALVGADFVKTSTGFSSGGATVADVKLMYSSVRTIGEIVPLDQSKPQAHVQVKASGGIQTASEAEEMLRSGATRIGTSRAAQWCAPSASQQPAAANAY